MAKLVAFYSRAGENYFAGEKRYVEVGNTEKVARMIAELTGADIFRIEQEQPYAADYATCVEQVKKDFLEKARPRLLAEPQNMGQYDEIYLGFPNYCGTMPMAVFTFLEQSDWTGRKICPFVTHEGSGFGRSEADLGKACEGAEIGRGLSVVGSKADDAGEEVKRWIALLEQ